MRWRFGSEFRFTFYGYYLFTLLFKGGRVTEWSGEPVSHPAIVQDGGFESRRRPAARSSLPPGGLVTACRIYTYGCEWMMNLNKPGYGRKLAV